MLSPSWQIHLQENIFYSNRLIPDVSSQSMLPKRPTYSSCLNRLTPRSSSTRSRVGLFLLLYSTYDPTLCVEIRFIPLLTHGNDDQEHLEREPLWRNVGRHYRSKAQVRTGNRPIAIKTKTRSSSLKKERVIVMKWSEFRDKQRSSDHSFSARFGEEISLDACGPVFDGFAEFQPSLRSFFKSATVCAWPGSLFKLTYSFGSFA